MGSKKNSRQVEFKFEFDRLGKQKIEQAYDMLLSKVLKDREKDKQELVHGGKKQ
jgi:hypothetical protein